MATSKVMLGLPSSSQRAKVEKMLGFRPPRSPLFETVMGPPRTATMYGMIMRWGGKGTNRRLVGWLEGGGARSAERGELVSLRHIGAPTDQEGRVQLHRPRAPLSSRRPIARSPTISLSLSLFLALSLRSERQRRRATRSEEGRRGEERRGARGRKGKRRR